jgi:hypothetical protein
MKMMEDSVTKIRDVLRGLIYKDDFFFILDALSQMTRHKTTVWTTRIGHIKHWVLPMSGINGG